MNELRHVHPHVDPRQPRDGSRPGTNPPVFAWKPPQAAARFCLQAAADERFTRLALDERELAEPVFLPERALPDGAYYWRWRCADTADDWSPVFRFTISTGAVKLEIPSVSEWLKRLPQGHPRIYINSGPAAELRRAESPERSHLLTLAAELLEQRHEFPEPPFLPDRRKDHQNYFSVWYGIMHQSRAFVRGAETLGLAYLSSGDEKFARAACTRLDSICRWDPRGSSYLEHNDEAHMSVIWHGPQACDFVWDCFTPEERERVIAQYRERGRITFEHMHGKGSYGVTRFDSHAGREIVFLATIALVFHEHIPEAREWLAWLRPVLCGIWPVWAGDDGAWAEGHSYGTAYVSIMTHFASALKRSTGIDLYRRPFWLNHARWRAASFPHYAEWIGFGDHSEAWKSGWESIASLVELIGVETGCAEFGAYVAALRKQAAGLSTPPERVQLGINTALYLARASAGTASASRPKEKRHTGEPARMLDVFPEGGSAAIRTNPDDASRDVALLFRASPLGNISHSHSNQNDFILHVAGRALLMPSGYYDGYASDHHAHWVWHTKSHNCVTLSDAGQRQRSHDAVARIEQPYEDERIAYFRGNADAAYTEAQRMRRHVLFLKKSQAFVLIDQFEAKPDANVALQWNVHAWAPFAVNEEARSFLVERGGSAVRGHVLHEGNGFFSRSEGWDPPPMALRFNEQWRMQYHLRFTRTGFARRANFAVVLAPAYPEHPGARVERGSAPEITRIGDDQLAIDCGAGLKVSGRDHAGLAHCVVQGQAYLISEDGASML